MKRVLLLGSTGMLGKAVREALLENPAVSLFELNRETDPGFDAAQPSSAQGQIEIKLSEVGDVDFVINAIGLTKVGIARSPSDAISLAKAINVNFPRHLLEVCAQAGVHVLTVGTDCIFSGSQGPYFEDSIADATDTYGYSKRLGEITSPNSTIVRSSFIGLQSIDASPMLLEWLVRQPRGASLHGYTNHLWNGTTASLLSRILAGMVTRDFCPPGTYHLVPHYQYSKFDLVELITRIFGRQDLEVIPFKTPEAVDRRLGTRFPEINETLWGFVGTEVPRRIDDSILELSERRAREHS